MDFISYIRVSTKKQGQSGLGLEAQRAINEQHAKSVNGNIIAEYQDVESGKKRKRRGLNSAIEHCRKSGATLLVAKLDRLARDVEFTFSIVNSGIEIHFCDMPVMNTMILGVFASVAQYERELTSKRTKATLAVLKAQGIELGAPNATFTDEQRALSADIRKIEAYEASRKYLEAIHMYRDKGLTLQAIADKLNSQGFTTPRGKAFRPSTIKMYLTREAVAEDIVYEVMNGYY